MELVHLEADGDAAEDAMFAVVADVVEDRRIGHDLLGPPDVGDIDKAAPLVAHRGGHYRVAWMNETGTVQVEGDATAFDVGLAGVLAVGGYQPAVGIQAADIPVFGMGDDPPLVIEQEGVVAAVIGREQGGEVCPRVDVLGEFHQVPVVQREHHHSGEGALRVEKRRAEAHHSLVAFPVVGGFGVLGACQLLVLQDMEAGQVRDVDLSGL